MLKVCINQHPSSWKMTISWFNLLESRPIAQSCLRTSTSSSYAIKDIVSWQSYLIGCVKGRLRVCRYIQWNRVHNQFKRTCTHNRQTEAWELSDTGEKLRKADQSSFTQVLHHSDSSQGYQMAIARILDCMCLALRAWRTMASLCCPAKFDPFLSLDCTPHPPLCRNPREGRDQILPSGNTACTHMYK